MVEGRGRGPGGQPYGCARWWGRALPHYRGMWGWSYGVGGDLRRRSTGARWGPHASQAAALKSVGGRGWGRSGGRCRVGGPWARRAPRPPPLFQVPSVGSSLVAQMVKCLCVVRETWVRSLGWEVPLEKEMATHSSTRAWKIPWMEEPGRLWGHKKSDTTERLHFTADNKIGCLVEVDVLPDGFHLAAVARAAGLSWKWACGRSILGPRWGRSAPPPSS